MLLEVLGCSLEVQGDVTGAVINKVAGLKGGHGIGGAVEEAREGEVDEKAPVIRKDPEVEGLGATGLDV